jgi:hypothetical protein
MTTTTRIRLQPDRTDPAWERIRAACSEISAADVDLDKHADRAYLLTHPYTRDHDE